MWLFLPNRKVIALHRSLLLLRADELFVLIVLSRLCCPTCLLDLLYFETLPQFPCSIFTDMCPPVCLPGTSLRKALIRRKECGKLVTAFFLAEAWWRGWPSPGGGVMSVAHTDGHEIFAGVSHSMVRYWLPWCRPSAWPFNLLRDTGNYFIWFNGALFWLNCLILFWLQ